jgi:hypothetical protein
MIVECTGAAAIIIPLAIFFVMSSHDHLIIIIVNMSGLLGHAVYDILYDMGNNTFC